MPLEIPVPKAFEKASFAANLFAKQLGEFMVFPHFEISSLLNNLERKSLLLADQNLDITKDIIERLNKKLKSIKLN